MTRLSTSSLLAVIFSCTIISCQPDFTPEIVYIPGGEFVMGCDSMGDDDESPAHCLTVQPFYLGLFEVTQQEWVRIMRYNPSVFKGDDRPVENVSWEETQQFIDKLNRITGERFRLPTEAEWEFAAKCGNSMNNFDYSTNGWWLKNSNEKTHPVGVLKPNHFGLYDMVGNVHEWCAEPYDSLSYKKVVGIISNDIKSTTDEVVARGGNWASDRHYIRVTNRNHAPKNYKSPTVGFRVAMDAE
ncbi:MAG: formylglycine-generating enzyme family protein [Alistipes sp.]|nr:formylglycine-generating enzyme family protein [Alistipes sp.]